MVFSSLSLGNLPAEDGECRKNFQISKKDN